MSKKMLFLFLIPILGIFLFPKPAHSTTPDPFSKQDGYNSGLATGQFNSQVEKVWSIPHYPISTPIIAENDLIYYEYTPGSPSQHIYSKNIYSEKENWALDLNSQKTICQPIYDGDYIYTCENNILAVSESTGTVLRQYTSSSNNFTRVVSAGNLIVGFTQTYNRMIAFDKISGIQLWSKNLSKYPFGAIIFAEGKLVFNSNPYYGETDAINVLDGSFAWKNSYIGTVGDLIYNPTSRHLYDPSRKLAISIDDGSLTALDTGRGWPFVSGNQLIYYYASSGNINFAARDLLTGTLTASEPEVIANTSFGSNPLLVDNKIYFISYNNYLFQLDLSGHCLNCTTATKLNDYDGFQGQILIDNGRLITYDTWHNEISYYDVHPEIVTSEDNQLVSPYRLTGMSRYLGQLHTHVEPEKELTNTNLFKNPPTAYNVEMRYKEAGYDFIALTEHNKIVADPGVAGILHIANAEEITQEAGGNHILALGINSVIGIEGSDQERVDAVTAQDGLPILAHPNATQYNWSLEQLQQVSGYNLIEIFNSTMDAIKALKVYIGSSYSIDKWDKLLSAGKIIYGTADDDYTPYDGGFNGGAVEVLADRLQQSNILNSLKTGNFYALQGSDAPRFENISTSGNTINTTLNQPCDITFVGKNGKKLQISNSTTSSSYTSQGTEVYVRVEAKSVATGKYSWSQPIQVKTNNSVVTNRGGIFDLALIQGELKSFNTDIVRAESSIWDFVSNSIPPGGFLSPVYNFISGGQVLDGTALSVNYDLNQLQTDPNNLSIYYYNETSKTWEKMPSTIDEINQTVTAKLEHFSRYVLSSEEPNTSDQTTATPEDSPQSSADIKITISSPKEREYLSGISEVAGSYTSQFPVSKIQLFIDDVFISETVANNNQTFDIPTDWNLYQEGAHRIEVFVTDNSNNYNSKSIPIHIGVDSISSVDSTSTNTTVKNALLSILNPAIPFASANSTGNNNNTLAQQTTPEQSYDQDIISSSNQKTPETGKLSGVTSEGTNNLKTIFLVLVLIILVSLTIATIISRKYYLQKSNQ